MLLTVVAAIVLSGCAFQPAPELTITDSRITATSDEGIVLVFDLDLRNRSDQPQELREMRYDLLVDGETVYSGRRAPLATLKGSGTQRIQLPAVVRHDRIQETDGPDASVSLPEQFHYELRGSILYIAPGHIAEILMDTGVRRPRIRFSETGAVQLSEE